MITYDELFIGGRWVTPASSSVIEIRSPHDGSLTGRTPEATHADIDRAVDVARAAFDSGPWPRTSPEERQALIARFAALHAQRTDLPPLVVSENGSPSWFVNAVQGMLPEQNAAYLRAAAAFPWEIERTTTAGQRAVLRAEPVGVVAAIIPWNAPQQSALVKIVPALLAGCTVVFKPSPETALNGIALGEIFAEAGLPEGVLSIVPAHREVSEYLVGRPGVDKIAFTGSSRAGRIIAATAGQHLKRVSLELGGKSAAIVLDDADIASTVENLKYASLPNSGQACIAQTRVLVQRDQYDDMVEALAEMVASLPVGDPADPANYVGPLVTSVQQERVASYIQLGEQEGAKIVVGGPGRPGGEELAAGNYVRPTLFAGVDNRMRIAREEIFGPVVGVIPYDDVDDAVAIANDSEYGLCGAVWTSDPERGLDVCRRVRTGTISVNATLGDFDSPFGGYKSSGLGREFGTVGLGHYVEHKSIVV